MLAHAGRAREDADLAGAGREDPQGLDGARGGLLWRAKLAGAGERGLAVRALQPDAAAHAGDGVDDQADLFHGVTTPGVYHPASPPWIPAFAGMTMALRRPHKGMKMASSLGMVEADPAPGPSSGTPQDDMTGRPGAIFIAMTGGGGHPHPGPLPSRERG